jgi:hypothetical protein
MSNHCAISKIKSGAQRWKNKRDSPENGGEQYFPDFISLCRFRASYFLFAQISRTRARNMWATTCSTVGVVQYSTIFSKAWKIGVLILGRFVLVVVFLILLVLLLPNQKGKRLGVLFGKIQDTLRGQSVATGSP